MDEAAHKIEAHIDRTRERLGSNLRELEHRVDAATDWREQFRARPHLFLGGAVAGGALLAAVLHQRSSRPDFDASHAAHLGSITRSSNGVNATEQALELWHNIKGALIGVAAMRITEYISELIPGFDEHYRHTAQHTKEPQHG